MSDELSLWGAVAQRYAEPRELRAGDLTGRFTARFESATLILRKSNSVERVIDFDEFRAAWRTIAVGGADVTLRLITANGAYLRAVRDDLIASGVAVDAEIGASDADDLSTAERRLLDEAERRSRPAPIPDGAGEPDHEMPDRTKLGAEVAAAALSVDEASQARIADLEGQLAAERGDNEAAHRENARLVASIETLEERLRLETDRATELESAVARIKAQPAPKAVGIGMGGDAPGTLMAVAASMVMESTAPEELRKAASIAIKLVQQDPPSAITKARVVTELLVKQEWSEVFNADPQETRKLFGDYARELDGQPGVDTKMLAVQRTLYRVASPGAHELRVSTRRAAMVVLVLAAVLNAYKPRA